MQKIYLLIILFVLSVGAYGQEQRKLDYSEEIQKIDITQDGTILLFTDLGSRVIYSENPDSGWTNLHISNNSEGKRKLTPRFYNVGSSDGFMLGERAFDYNVYKIIYSNLQHNGVEKSKSYCYVEFDEGFNDSVYTWFEDFGNIIRITNPFNSIASIKLDTVVRFRKKKRGGIFSMNHDGSGIYLKDSFLYFTYDFWKSIDSFEVEHSEARDWRNYYEGIWGKYFILKFGKGLYVRQKEKSDLIKLSDSVAKFYVNSERNELLVCKVGGELVKYSAPDRFVEIAKGRIVGIISVLKYKGGVLYVVDDKDNLYRFTDTGCKVNHLFAKEQDVIPGIQITKHGKKWFSISDKNIYQSNNSGKNWTVLEKFPFHIEGINLISDTELVIYDRDECKNYGYSLKTGSIDDSDYVYSHPLSDFLKYPLYSIHISKDDYSCGRASYSWVDYEKVDESHFKSFKKHSRFRDRQADSDISRANSVSIDVQQLLAPLFRIERGEKYVHKIEDFILTPIERDSLKSYAKWWINSFEPITNIVTDRYKTQFEREFNAKVDTLLHLENYNNSIFQKFISDDKSYYLGGMGCSYVSLVCINDNNDTLSIKSNDIWRWNYLIANPVFTLRFHNKLIPCNDVAINQLFDKLAVGKLYDEHHFDKFTFYKQLIYKLAETTEHGIVDKTKPE